MAEGWHVLALRHLEMISIFLNPVFSIRARKSFSTNAPPMHLNQSFVFFLSSSDNGSFRTISQKTVLPPFFRTRHTSLITASLSGDRLYMPFEATTSKNLSSKGSLSDSPTESSTFLIPANPILR